MRILITGVSGFLGKNLLNSLTQMKCEIVSIGRVGFNKKISNYQYIYCDLLNLEKIESDLLDFNPHILIHLAWFGIPILNKENSEINKQITIKLINFIDKSKSLKKIISIGSCLEYKNQNQECFETDQLETNEPFPNAKYFTQKLLTTKSNDLGIDCYWLRVFYLYGLYQKKSSLIPSIIKSLVNKESPNIYNPYEMKDYISVKDVVKIINKIIFSDFQKGTYNVGTGITYSPIEITRLIEKTMYNSDKLTNNISLYKKNEKQQKFYANIDRLGKQYNVKTFLTLESEIKFLLNNIKNLI